jgi:hypothetical protein
VPIYQASQEYRHEYSGHRRQKVFNDSVHGETRPVMQVLLCCLLASQPPSSWCAVGTTALGLGCTLPGPLRCCRALPAAPGECGYRRHPRVPALATPEAVGSCLQGAATASAAHTPPHRQLPSPDSRHADVLDNVCARQFCVVSIAFSAALLPPGTCEAASAPPSQAHQLAHVWQFDSMQ